MMLTIYAKLGIFILNSLIIQSCHSVLFPHFDQIFQDQNGAVTGLWLIDQPYHALYEATLYDFRANGRLVMVQSMQLGGTSEDFVTGTVSWSTSKNCTSLACATITCRFGDRWRSISQNQIAIEGDCDDHQSREIILEITSKADQGTYAVDVLTVDGKPGWRHLGWDWRFSRCEELDTCLTAFAPLNKTQ